MADPTEDKSKAVLTFDRVILVRVRTWVEGSSMKYRTEVATDICVGPAEIAGQLFSAMTLVMDDNYTLYEPGKIQIDGLPEVEWDEEGEKG